MWDRMNTKILACAPITTAQRYAHLFADTIRTANEKDVLRAASIKIRGQGENCRGAESLPLRHSSMKTLRLLAIPYNQGTRRR